MPRPRVTNLLLLAAVVVVIALPLGLRLGAGSSDGEPCAGTDSVAVKAVQEIDPGFRPWHSPWFEPSSGEIESGLFAVQAAAGAGVLGFVLGRLAGRRQHTP